MLQLNRQSIPAMRVLACAVCLLFAPASWAQAPAATNNAQVKQVKATATITEIKGDVLVYQGDKYIPAKKGMRVADGDRILSMHDSSAKLTYDNGCLDEAEASSLYDVSSISPACLLLLNETIAQVSVPPAMASGFFNDPVFVGGTIALIILAVEDDDDDKARAVSP